MSTKHKKAPRKAEVIYLGPIRDDDPRYTGADWNFIAGKNLNLQKSTAPEAQAADKDDDKP